MTTQSLAVIQVKPGGDRNFSYLISDRATGLAAVVDPSYDPAHMLDISRRDGLTLIYLINTHGHPDHTNGNDLIIAETGARVIAHPLLKPDIPAEDGAVLPLGESTLNFIHTPGHTADSICILAGKYLLTGDTLFVGKVGGTRIGRDARLMYESLHQKLLVLPDDTIVCPGHDFGVEPVSTIGNEKKTNPFFLQDSFEKFQELKRTWLEYKRMHGIA